VRLQNGCDLIEMVSDGELEPVVCGLLAGVDQELNHSGILPMLVTEVRRTVDGRAKGCASVLLLQVEPGAAG
jgi:hypothetical protein